MGLVGKQQAAEVTFGTFITRGIAAKSLTTTGRRWFIVEAIDPLQGTVGRPGPQEGAMDGEML